METHYRGETSCGAMLVEKAIETGNEVLLRGRSLYTGGDLHAWIPLAQAEELIEKGTATQQDRKKRHVWTLENSQDGQSAK